MTGTPGRTRTLNKGFGDPRVTITPCPYAVRPGLPAQASQGSVAPLTERSDETFSVKQFFSADRE